MKTRVSRDYLAGRYVAQEARRDMREGDPLYAQGNGTERFHSSAATVHTDQCPARPSTPLDVHAAKAAAQPGTLYWIVQACRNLGLPEPSPEHRFHPTRRWRFDFAWPKHKVALEIEGGIWTQGRHTRGAGALADLEKYSEAAIAGWRVIYCTPGDLSTTGMERVRRAIG